MGVAVPVVVAAMIIGTAGHIDHGKTALVQLLTGVNTDRLPEEKRRGITIELGFAPLDLPGVGRVGVVDVPGHEGFIRTMVAGATGVDLGLLVVAADEGVMPQTREHLTILRLLGVQSLVVALTKYDLADAEWLSLVRDDVATLLSTTPYAGAALVDVSARTGYGLDALRERLADELKAVARRSMDDLFRLPIDRAFTVRGTGTVVTGTSWSGTVRSGGELRLYPGGRPVRLRGIQSHGAAVHEAGPGSRLALSLSGVELDQVHRGMTLASPAPWRETHHFHAEVQLSDDAAPFRPREWIRLHVATSEVSARVVITDAGVLARIVTEEPVVLRAGDRFVLRRSQPLSTIGGGIVIDPAPLRPRSRPSSGWNPDAHERFRTVLAAADESGIAVDSLPIQLGCSPTVTREVLLTNPAAVPFRDAVFPGSLVGRIGEVIVAEVFAFNTSHGTEAGAPISLARQATRNEALADLVVEGLVRSGALDLRGGVLSRPGWSPRLSEAQERLARQIHESLRAAGREPPSVGELESGSSLPVVPVLRFMERCGRVIAVEADRYYDREVLGSLLTLLVSHLGQHDGPVPPAMLRESLGMSRKYLMPFLEYCDRDRITERRGDGRVLAQGARERVAAFLDTPDT